MLKANNMFDVKEDTNGKYSAINHLKTLRTKIILDNKEILILFYILFILINSMPLNLREKI